MSGPVKRANITLEESDDGKLVHTFRQSTLGELDICAERGRLTMTGDMPKVETDAACLGTAVHAGFEEMLWDKKDGDDIDLEGATEAALNTFDFATKQPEFVWVKYHPNGKIARKFIVAALKLFEERVIATMDPQSIELPFGPLTIHEDDERVINLTGTIDIVDWSRGVGDWKTAGDPRKYQAGMGGKAWEITRWAIQPTVYLWACLEMGILDPERDEWPFTYWAFHMDGEEPGFNILEVTRHRGDFDWLRDKCMSHAHMVEAGLEVWPKNDNTALCSEKWCPAWDRCKGTNYATGWPKPSAPRV